MVVGVFVVIVGVVIVGVFVVIVGVVVVGVFVVIVWVVIVGVFVVAVVVFSNVISTFNNGSRVGIGILHFQWN